MCRVPACHRDRLLKRNVVVVAAMLFLSAPHWVHGAVSYGTPGELYTQNFDTATAPDGSTGLPNNSQGQSPNASIGTTGTEVYGWRNDYATSTAGNWSIVGWHMLHPLNASGTAGVDQEGGYNGNQRMRFGTGGSTTGAFYSFGNASASTERALGMVNSNTMTNATSPTHPFSYFGVAFTNDTGVTLNEFTLTYWGEQWRNSGDAAQHSLLFEYGLNAPNIHDANPPDPPLGTFVPVAALNFTGPLSGGTAAGNLGDANRVEIAPVTITGLNWQPGDTLWLRWKDANDAGADHGLAIDDLVFSAEIGEATELLGDHNDDGTVDAADYVAWRKLDEANTTGYDQFVQHFGETNIVVGSGGGGAVPEPGGVLLAVVAAAWLAARRRCRV